MDSLPRPVAPRLIVNSNHRSIIHMRFWLAKPSMEMVMSFSRKHLKQCIHLCLSDSHGLCSSKVLLTYNNIFVWVWCWQWPEIFGVAYDPSPPPPQSIRLFFSLNLWCSHRKGVNKQKMQPLQTVNSHVVIVMIFSYLCKKAHGLQTWHLMILPPLKAFSSWEAYKQTHLKF